MEQPHSLDEVLTHAFSVLDMALRKADPGEFVTTTQPALQQLGQAIALLRQELNNVSGMMVRSNHTVAAILRTQTDYTLKIPEKVLVEVDKEDLVQMAMVLDEEGVNWMVLKLIPKERPSKIIVPKLQVVKGGNGRVSYPKGR